MSCDYQGFQEHGLSHRHTHEGGHAHHHHGHHGHRHEGHHHGGDHHRRLAEERFRCEGGARPMAKVKEGDVLMCGCNDCNVELTVSKACAGDACGSGCEIDVRCCGAPMQVKAL